MSSVRFKEARAHERWMVPSNSALAMKPWKEENSQKLMDLKSTSAQETRDVFRFSPVRPSGFPFSYPVLSVFP